MNRRDLSIALFRLVIPVLVSVVANGPERTFGQSSGQTAKVMIGSQYIPSDATATAVLSIAESMKSESAKMFPVEVAEAWCEQNLGFAASDVQSVRLVIGVPGPSGPMASAVVSFGRDVAISELNAEVFGTDDSIEVDGKPCYTVPNTPGFVLHQKDPRTIILSTPNYLQSTLTAASPNAPPSGALAKMAASVPHTGNLTVLFAVEPVRPIVSGFVKSQSEQIPPPFAEFTKIPDLLEAVLIQLDLADAKSGMRLVMLGHDEASATELQGILAKGLEMGRQIALAQSMEQIHGDDKVAQASRQYAERFATSAVEMLTPTQNGRRLVLSGSPTTGVATQGILIGLLLPAVQSAREAARRVSDSNNLKEIGLAIHNYHAAYNRLPADILDANGKPMLSWRVTILPFIEEIALYESFHMDEPWDSPNNLPLLSRMPKIFQSPSVISAANTTVYQGPSGEAYLFVPGEQVRFRDVLDGLSNTIAVVSTDAAHAVEWSKPSDITIDPSDPLAFFGEDLGNGFHVLFGDGSVRFFDASVDPDLFHKLLTKAGSEIVEF